MKIGVIGIGRIGGMHARNLRITSGVGTVLLHDLVPGAAARAAAELGGEVEVRHDLDTMLEECDGVVVATNSSSHPAVVRRAVESRTPVLCEKPIASDLAAMRALVTFVEAAGETVVVGFQRRFDPALAALKHRIDAGELGDLYVIRATGYDAKPPDPSYVPTSGGIFRDLMIHDLDAVPWLVGRRVVSVSAHGSVLVDDMFAKADDVDVAAVTLTFEGGALAQLVATRHDPLGYDHRIEVLGSRDSVAVGLGSGAPLALIDENERTAPLDPFPGFPERFAPAYRAEMAAFTKIITGERANPSPVRDSLISLQLAEACERSRRSAAPVGIDAALRNPALKVGATSS